MKTWRLVVLGLVGAVGSCGPVLSKYPLSDPGTAKRDARLEGAWVGHLDKDEGRVVLLISRGDGAEVNLVFMGRDKAEVDTFTFEAFPSVIQGQTYLNVREKKTGGILGSREEETWGDWMFARYAFAKDGALEFAVMDEDPVKEALAVPSTVGSSSRPIPRRWRHSSRKESRVYSLPTRSSIGRSQSRSWSCRGARRV
jgi:hypothetical protein